MRYYLLAGVGIVLYIVPMFLFVGEWRIYRRAGLKARIRHWPKPWPICATPKCDRYFESDNGIDLITGKGHNCEGGK